MKYVIKMVYEPDKSEENYSEFKLLLEEDIEKEDLSGCIQSDSHTLELVTEIFSDCPYIKFVNSLEQIDSSHKRLERFVAFLIDDSFSIRQQLNFLNRYKFDNFKSVKGKLLEREKMAH